jgi:hypothetical protein
MELPLDGGESGLQGWRRSGRQLDDGLGRRPTGVDAEDEQLDGVGHRRLDRPPRTDPPPPAPADGGDANRPTHGDDGHRAGDSRNAGDDDPGADHAGEAGLRRGH